MELKKVKLERHDSCLTYALKRIGAANLIELDYYQLLKAGEFKQRDYKLPKGLKRGNLLLWDYSIKTTPIPNEITKDGKVIAHSYYYGLHFAVYEGKGLVSECSLNDDFVPSINLLRLNELKPSKVLVRTKQ
ncbi:MAG: hypothetical protein GY928_33940 [Colwellia sp.]|nr:hypothetical protein [Colwellia sp.]